MRLTTISKTTLILLGAGLFLSSCKKDEEPEPEPTPDPLMSVTYDYEFNNGQVVSSAAYDGMHNDNLHATMMVEELSDNESKITVTVHNTITGENYMVHAHDAADPATTPNGTPYDETPNANVFIQMGTGNGGDITLSQTVSMSYSAITSSYEGFFVIHDPLQAVNTADISTYLVVGAFARTQASSGLTRETYNYDFNTGQIDPSYAYQGTHGSSLAATLTLQELADGSTRVSAWLDNSINGESYMVHAHDAADPTTTPNGTPYDETPNSGLCVLMMSGNGGTTGSSQMSAMSITDITTNYQGFFVVHDPLQAVDTTDPTTYVVLGLFAQ